MISTKEELHDAIQKLVKDKEVVTDDIADFAMLISQLLRSRIDYSVHFFNTSIKITINTL